MTDQRISHTHCQAARALAKTKAWQRVCLPNRTTKTTDKPTDEKNTEPITFSLVSEKDPPDPCRESPPESFRDVGLFCSIRC